MSLRGDVHQNDRGHLTVPYIYLFLDLSSRTAFALVAELRASKKINYKQARTNYTEKVVYKGQ